MTDWLKSLSERSRQRVFAVMRSIGMEANQDGHASLDEFRAMDPRGHGRRLRLRSHAAEAFLEAIRRGAIPEQAAMTAQYETAQMALQFNLQSSSGESAPMEYIADMLERVNRANVGASA